MVRWTRWRGLALAGVLAAACDHISVAQPVGFGGEGPVFDAGRVPSMPCSSDQECSSGQACGFRIAEGCAAQGECIIKDCPPTCNIAGGGMCGCNGLAVSLVASGFATAPVSPTAGPCAACPLHAPTAGTACNGGAQCSYGSCFTFVCAGGSWAQPDPSCADAAAPGCPTDFASVPLGSACSADGLSCTYVEGLCGCTTLPGPSSGTPQWRCTTPAPLCPWPSGASTPCSVESQICNYGSCTIPGGYELRCVQGYWETQMAVCPDQ